MDHFVPFCKSIRLEVKGRQMELTAFVASLEAIKKMEYNETDEVVKDAAVGGEGVVSCRHLLGLFLGM